MIINKHKIVILLFIILFSMLMSSNVFCASRTFTCSNGHTFNNPRKERVEGSGRPGDPTYRENYYCPVCGEIVLENANPDAVYKELSDNEILERYTTIRKMIKDICSITSDNASNDDIMNVDAMVLQFFNGLIEGINSFQGTTMYSGFVGLGVFFLIINFSISLYQNTMNNERKTTEQVFRLTSQFIISLVIVANVLNFLKMFLGLFAWTLQNAISLKNSSGTTANGLDIADTITIKLCRAESLDRSGTLAGFEQALPAIGLQIMLFLPWLISLIAKFGMLFIIVKNSIEAMLYAMQYPIAAGDCFENIKQSRFMRYTRHIMGCLFQQTIVILTLYASQFLTAEVINNLIQKANDAVHLSNAEASPKLFNILILITVIQLSKMVVASSAAPTIAHRVFGE